MCGGTNRRSRFWVRARQLRCGAASSREWAAKGPKRRLGPKREQQVEHARAWGGKPECTWQSELHRGGQQRDWGDPIFDQNDNALSSAEIGLVDGAGVGVDASALHVACEPSW